MLDKLFILLLWISGCRCWTQRNIEKQDELYHMLYCRKSMKKENMKQRLSQAKNFSLFMLNSSIDNSVRVIGRMKLPEL